VIAVGAVPRRRGSLRAPQLLVHAIRSADVASWARSPSSRDNPVRPRRHQRVVAEVTHLASIAIAHTRNEAALRQNQQELRQVIDAIPQLIVAMSPAGQILYANEAVLESTGLSSRK